MTLGLLTIADALQWARAELSQSDSSELDAQLLLMKVLDCARSYLYTWPEQRLLEHQQQVFQELVSARKEGTPVAHLLGFREFWSLELEVNGSTLIPRPDTEVLVEHCLQLALPANADVLELGTGTGAIALALAVERPNWQITAADIASDAVALARRNVERVQALHASAAKVEVVQSDWFLNLSPARYHLIVSNPPYIRADDPHLSQGDVRFEPLRALVAENNGLADIEHIIHQSRGFLAHKGWLALEHGYDQAKEVQQLFRNYGYGRIQTRQDYGRLDRVTSAQFL